MAFSVSYVYKLLDKYSKPLEKISKAQKKYNKSLEKTQKTLSKVGKRLTLGVTLPTIAFGAAIVSTAYKFEKKMNMVRAVTRATDEEMQEMRKVAKDLGSTTQFSAVQAAAGMEFLGMAGNDVKTIISALPRTLELAASAQLDLGDAADIVTNIMTGYGIKTSELARINDVLVGMFTSANVRLTDLGYSFKYVGTQAKYSGWQFEETAALLALLGDSGIQAESGGRAVRQIIIRLQKPTAEAGRLIKKLRLQFTYLDKQGKTRLKPAIKILEMLKKANIGVAESAILFGTESSTAALAAIANIPKYRKLLAATKEVGRAHEVALMQMEGLPGAVALIASAFEGLKLVVWEGVFGKITLTSMGAIAGFLQDIAKTHPYLLDSVTVLMMLGSTLGPLLEGLSRMAIVLAVLKYIGARSLLPLVLMFGKVIAIIIVVITVLNILVGIFKGLKRLAREPYMIGPGGRKAGMWKKLFLGEEYLKGKGYAYEPINPIKPVANTLNGSIKIKTEPNINVVETEIDTTVPGKLGLNVAP
jgi:TP901 family phage tail tape measure protein